MSEVTKIAPGMWMTTIHRTKRQMQAALEVEDVSQGIVTVSVGGVRKTLVSGDQMTLTVDLDEIE